MNTYENLKEIIASIKNGEKENFQLIVNCLLPLINKYAKILYKDNYDDSKSEFVLALWEAIQKIDYQQFNNSQIFSYLSTAIYTKFHELYRKSKNLHLEEPFDIDYITATSSDFTNPYNNLLLYHDLFLLINSYTGLKYQICSLIIFYHLCDTEIATTLNLSRQYVNRIRRQLQSDIIKQKII